MKSEKRPDQPIENLAFGTVIEVDGTKVVAELNPAILELSRIHDGELYPIGQFGSIVKIHFGRRVLYGFVGRLRMKLEPEPATERQKPPHTDARVIEMNLFGEGEWVQRSEKEKLNWSLNFERGVSTFPLPQQTVYLTPTEELHYVYGHTHPSSVLLGEHVGSGGTPCYADIDELLGKHTAILGSTGSGKSCTVAAVIHSLLERGEKEGYKQWLPRIIFLDPHNEYSRAFPTAMRLSTDEGSLRLPYWMLNLQELIALFIGKTEFVATSQTNILKMALLKARQHACKKLPLKEDKISVDSPIPFSLADFQACVEEQRPKNSNQKDHEPFNSILNKLEVLKRDGRLRFLMEEWDGSKDEFPMIMRQLLGEGPSLRIVDLSGVPNEIAGVTSAVIARTLFNFKLWQTQEERAKEPVLLICEEAHRYVPNKGEAQYEAAQDAIQRIAKEGRKYGLGLILISQRPSEVDATVLSQCNSWIVLRITNEVDKNQVKAVLPDSLEHLTKVLSGLRRREAIFAGQAAMLPSRIMVRKLQEVERPKSTDISYDHGWQNNQLQESTLLEIGNRWRYQNRESDNPAAP